MQTSFFSRVFLLTTLAVTLSAPPAWAQGAGTGTVISGGSGGATTLDGLSDATITSAVASQPLVYNGTVFTNVPRTLNAGTGNEIAYTLAYTTNKATSGNDTGLLISMTDTASPGTSLPLDVQVGGTTQWKVSPTGVVTQLGIQVVPAGSSAAPSLQMGSLPSGLYTTGTGTGIVENGQVRHFFHYDRFISNNAIGFSSTGVETLGGDVFWMRDAANVMALRRYGSATTAQELRVYSTYTDDSNRCYGSLSGSTTGVTLAANTAGTCADDQNITLTTSGTGTLNTPTTVFNFTGGDIQIKQSVSTDNLYLSSSGDATSGARTTGSWFVLLDTDADGSTEEFRVANNNAAFGSATTLLSVTGDGIGIGTAAIASSWAAVPAGTTAKSQLFLTTGVAPSAPNNGDVWFDGTHAYIRIGGASVQLDN